jgi:hypothetical protein
MVLNPPDDTVITRHPLAEAIVRGCRWPKANAVARKLRRGQVRLSGGPVVRRAAGPGIVLISSSLRMSALSVTYAAGLRRRTSLERWAVEHDCSPRWDESQLEHPPHRTEWHPDWPLWLLHPNWLRNLGKCVQAIEASKLTITEEECGPGSQARREL